MSTSRPPRDLDELAAEPLDAHDLQALAQLASLYELLDPVPAGLVDRIRFGITLDALHAEIADLQRSGSLSGARSDDAATAAQTVTFTSPSLTTMITITPTTAEHARIDGWAAPGGGVHVELRTSDGVLVTQADSDGRFVFDEVPRGLGQFVLRHPEDSGLPPVVTPSIEI